ncbi:hypothetical protein HN873_039402, partial [Arachis hypogaea]
MLKFEHKGQLSSKMAETRNLNCSFKPPQDMRLSEDLVNVAMYIFATDNDIAEDLFHIHDTTATREDLFCLVPGKQVFELDDVSLHMEDHDLLKKYAHYMPPTRDLQF